MKRVGEVIATEGSENIALDDTDRAIINLLSLNSRLPFSVLARLIGRTTEVVNYRYLKLREGGLITDTFTIINPQLLGIKRYIVYLQFHALSQEKMRSIITKFLANPHINWIIESGGKWELLLMIETIHEHLLDKILDTIMFPIRNYVNDYMLASVRNFVHRGPRYVRSTHGRDFTKEITTFPYYQELHGKKETLSSIDQKDIRLLKLLHDDSRIHLTDLGNALNLSPDAVNYRIQRLIRGDIIKGFIIRLNYHLLQFQYTSVMIKLRNISPKRKLEFLHHVYENERFYSMLEQIGAWDISFLMYFVSAKDLRDFLIAIKENYSDVIHSYETAIHFDQYYYTYLCNGVIKELLENR